MRFGLVFQAKIIQILDIQPNLFYCGKGKGKKNLDYYNWVGMVMDTANNGF